MIRLVHIYAMIVIAMMLQSCSTTYHYVQVVRTQPAVQDTCLKANHDGYEFRNGDLVVTYRMWSGDGRAQFDIYNLSNEILYVDLEKSFFIKNGLAFNYFEEVTYSETYGTNIINRPFVSFSYDYKATATSSTVSTKKQQIIAIPPMSGKNIDAFQIADGHLLDCNLINYPEDKSSVLYAEEDSPIHFANYITYRLGDKSEDVALRHEFYVSEVINYVKPAYVVYEKRAKKCESVLTPSEAKQERNAPEVYDARLSVPTDGCFYYVYEVTSRDRLYKTSGSGPYYYWNSQYNGYTTSSSESSSGSSSTIIPRMDK